MSSSTFSVLPSLTPCCVCGEETSLVCAVCLKTRFCSRPCAAKAWAGHRAACAEFSVLAALLHEASAPVRPIAPGASTEKAAGSSSPSAFAGSGFSCAVCGSSNAAVCARCRLVGYCGAGHQRKDWPAHKLVCRKGEFGIVPALTWEQRVLAEAAAAAPAALAAKSAWPPIADWDLKRNGAPPTKIMRAWRKAAAGGHAVAQLNLGICFFMGLGVAKDEKAGAGLLAQSAAQGCAGAQCTLGLITQDVKAAFVCFAKAAAQGSANAAFSLGLFFEQGCGATQDFKAAAKWFAVAAAKNVADAQYKLGCLLNTGVGVSQDSVAAATWFAKAAAQGHAGAQHNLGVAYFKGAGVALDFELADRWFRKAAAQGQRDAINALARIQRARADAAAARPRG